MEPSQEEITLSIPVQLLAKVATWADREQRSLNQQILYVLAAAQPDAVVGRPEGWGRDSLSEFAERHLTNSLAFFQQLPEWTQRLALVNDQFRMAGHNFADPEDLYGAFFLARAESAFLAASIHAMAGQVGDIEPLNRNCLEWALYAFAFRLDPDKRDAWLDRNEGPDGKRRAKRASQISKMLETLREDHPALAAQATAVYETTIDFGAHPNVQALFGNMAGDGSSDGAMVLTSKFLTSDEFEVRVAMKGTARAGIAALRIFEVLFPERFSALGISRRLEELSEGL